MALIETDLTLKFILTFLSSSVGRGSRPVWSESSPRARLRLWWRCPASSPADSDERWPHSVPLPVKRAIFKNSRLIKTLFRAVSCLVSP